MSKPIKVDVVAVVLVVLVVFVVLVVVVNFVLVVVRNLPLKFGKISSLTAEILSFSCQTQLLLC